MNVYVYGVLTAFQAVGIIWFTREFIRAKPLFRLGPLFARAYNGAFALWCAAFFVFDTYHLMRTY